MAFAASPSVALWEHRNASLPRAMQHVVADREVRPPGSVFVRGVQDYPFFPLGQPEQSALEAVEVSSR